MNRRTYDFTCSAMTCKMSVQFVLTCFVLAHEGNACSECPPSCRSLPSTLQDFNVTVQCDGVSSKDTGLQQPTSCGAVEDFVSLSTGICSTPLTQPGYSISSRTVSCEAVGDCTVRVTHVENGGCKCDSSSSGDASSRPLAQTALAIALAAAAAAANNEC